MSQPSFSCSCRDVCPAGVQPKLPAGEMPTSNAALVEAGKAAEDGVGRGQESPALALSSPQCARRWGREVID